MLDRIKEEMHLYEKKVLKALESEGGESTPERVLKLQLLPIKSVMSAAGILASKNIIKVNKDVDELLSLSEDGASYAQDGLPERRILKALGKEETVDMKDLSQKSGIEPSEVKIAIGWLLRKGWATLDKGQVTISSQGMAA
ncbi:MAG TPA: phenylalanine--tRNA ligase subunit alpha, partial [Methanobacteriaceae archaeon]|nr:phenylalanine--tRNA ligase subunit alpha [Methanobacteriaceae archaeon]